MSVWCHYLCVCMSVSLQPSKLDLQTSQNCSWWCPWLGSFNGKSNRAVGHRICGPSRIIQWDKSVLQNKQQQNNTTTITFFPEKKVLRNLEDTAEKALAQYWDDVLWWQPKNECSWRLHISSVPTVTNKLFYCRQTARHAISNKILSIAAAQL